MGKSVNDYYSDKMKKLLENQKATDATPRIVAPSQSSVNNSRQYYENFRKNSEKAKQEKAKQEARRFKVRPKQMPRPDSEKGERPKINPEQTLQDKQREEREKERAKELAIRARNRRKIRDGLISGILIFAVTVLISFVAYRLLFVVKTVNVEGELSIYTAEQITEAADIADVHLFSFKESVAERNVILSCPLIESVDVVRHIPSSVTLKVVEVSPVYYCDFYGEKYGLTSNLRVVDAVSDTAGLGKIKLPAIKSALVGEAPVFNNVKNDSYIFSVTEQLGESALGSRISFIDLTDRFNIRVAIDGKYMLLFGDTSSFETKIKIAVGVLDNELFKGNEKKYKIDLSDMSQTSVIQDENLNLDN